MFLDRVGNHPRANILYDPSHFLLQQLDYLAFIDIYHERIKAFHVKDAEFRPSGRQGVYSGYQPWLQRAGRFRSLGDGQIDFRAARIDRPAPAAARMLEALGRMPDMKTATPEMVKAYGDKRAAIDKVYLNSIGWRGIRQRKLHVEELLRDHLHVMRDGQPQPSGDDVLADWHGRFGSPTTDENGGTATRLTLYRSVGCEHCNHTGYRGRAGIHELMAVTRTLRHMIQTGRRSDDLQAQALADGMRTLRQDGIEKVLAGITTIEEVLRSTPGLST